MDTFQSKGTNNVSNKNYGPLTDDAMLILHNLPEETFSASYGQERLQILINGFAQTNQQTNKEAEQIITANINLQNENIELVKSEITTLEGYNFLTGQHLNIFYFKSNLISSNSS